MTATECSVRIRPARPSEIEALAAFSNSLHDPSVSEPPEVMAARAALDPEAALCAWEGGRLVGCVVGHPWAGGLPPFPFPATAKCPGPPDFWYIHEVGVAHTHRGRRLSRRLVDATLAAAARRNLDRVVAVAVNPWFGERLRRNYGFEPVGVTRYADIPGTILVRDAGRPRVGVAGVAEAASADAPIST